MILSGRVNWVLFVAYGYRAAGYPVSCLSEDGGVNIENGTMRASTLRERVSDFDALIAIDDLAGIVIGLGVWLGILIAAPLIVLVLAGLLFSVELPVLIIIGALLALARFAGVIPWTVVTLDPLGQEQRAYTRSFVRAFQQVRRANGDRRVSVRWAWV